MGKKEEIFDGVVIPELIQDQSDMVKKLYAEWWKLGEKIKEHPDRWQYIPHKKNPEETVKIDLRQAWVICVNQMRHLTEEERSRYKKLWLGIQMLKIKKGRLRIKWEKMGKNISTREVLIRKAGDLIELFGKYKTVDEVVAIIKDWGYHVNRKQVHDFAVANKDKIGLLRDEWSSSYGDFSLAQKRGRVEKLVFLAKTQMDKYKQDEKYLISHSKELRAIYEQIKKEIEGERLILDIDGNIDPVLTIEANKTLSEVLRRVSLTSLVVSIVAAKRGIDPTSIVTQLQNSIYSKFSGVKNHQGNFERSKPKPLNEVYDWIAIEKLHAKEVEYEDIKTEVVEEKKQEVNEKRNKLLDLLNESSDSHMKNRKGL